MAFTSWNSNGLLCAYYGRASVPLFTWTYSVFEKHLNEFITPSMYNFMAEYVENHMCDYILAAIYDGEYIPGYIESDAVNVYFETHINDRIEMHNQELCDLRDTVRYLEAWGEHQEEFERVSRLLFEETRWVGGHE